MTGEKGKLEFDDKQTGTLMLITQYHEIAKELVIFGEEIDPGNRTLIQPINELRNCLDHLNRIFLYKMGLRHESEDEDYVKENLGKAYGHVYRAVYDALDWVSLTLKGRIVEEMNDFSLDTIQAVMPEYFKDIKPRMERILYQDIAALRMEKDVAISNEENLIKYGQLTIEMKELFGNVITRKSSLVEYELKHRRSRLKERVWQIIIAIVGGGFLFWLLDKFVINQPPA
jgi:hypothetical protein